MSDSPQQGRLVLEDGAVFRGRAFGKTDGGGRGAVAAEVVFNTAMTGYQEALTDPSYVGQILVMTAPLIGNTGINPQDVESSRVQVSGFVVRELTRVHSNYRATGDLSAYLADNNVIGLERIDTRALTRRLRETGSMRGVITADPSISDQALLRAAREAPTMDGQNLVQGVSTRKPADWNEGLDAWGPDRTNPATPPRVIAIDCGAKRNILRHLTDRGCDVRVIPHDADLADIVRTEHPDGIFVSNGPGDPAAVEQTVSALRTILAAPDAPPIFGICLGHQLLSLALGAKTFKLKFGHRGANQPVLHKITGGVEITSQNHGFAVDPDSLAACGGTPTHIHLNDGTLAGFCLDDRPVFAVQYHPEASPGPHDSAYLFDAFVNAMSNRPESTLRLLSEAGKRAGGAAAKPLSV